MFLFGRIFVHFLGPNVRIRPNLKILFRLNTGFLNENHSRFKLLLPVNSGKKVGRVLPGQANSDHVVAWVSCLCLAPAKEDIY